MTRIVLVRHGETPASLATLLVGSTEVDLTGAGHEQAKAVAGRLQGAGLDALYVSPLRRCQQTAVPVAEMTGLQPVVDPQVRECHFGEWEGLALPEVARRDPQGMQAWRTEDAFDGHGGESWKALGERMWEWCARIAQEHPDRTVCAVTHGGPIRTLLRVALGAPYRAVLQVRIDPASVTVVQNRGSAFVGLDVQLVNDCSHLGDPLARR